MHTCVYCGTVHNSKDLELTQMAISDRLDKENVAHTHHGVLGTWISIRVCISLLCQLGGSKRNNIPAGRSGSSL